MPLRIVLTLIAAYGLAVVALTVAAGKKLDKPRPCRRTFEQVQVGMTQAEVEAVVGAPPGDYCSRNRVLSGGALFLDSEEEWVSDRAKLWVDFGNEGRVSVVKVSEISPLFLTTRGEQACWWLFTGYRHFFWSTSQLTLITQAPRYDLSTFVRILCD